MLFTEDFLHYIWKFRLFDHADLKTVDGEAIHIYTDALWQQLTGKSLDDLWKTYVANPVI